MARPAPVSPARVARGKRPVIRSHASARQPSAVPRMRKRPTARGAMSSRSMVAVNSPDGAG